MYYNVTVKEIIRETDDAISIVFANPGNEISYKPGQFITLVLPIEGEEFRRPYSLSSSPDQESNLAVTIKKIDRGKVSQYLVDQLKPGQEIKIMAPSGKFTTDFDSKSNRTFVFFAGGSGITPLMSIMKAALVREPSSRIILVYQNRNEHSIIFKKVIDEFQAKYPGRIEVMHILSQPSETWQGTTGRLSPDQVKNLFRQYAIPFNNSTVFICGPQGMMDMVDTTLEDLGYDKRNTFKERFSTSDLKEKASEKLVQVKGKPEQIMDKPRHIAEKPVHATDKPGQAMEKPENATLTFPESKVTIILDNEEYELMIKPDEFILEAALDADLNMPFSCQSGICTTCRGKLISGEVRMEDPEGLSEEEIASGYILTCVSHPVSKDLEIEMG